MRRERLLSCTLTAIFMAAFNYILRANGQKSQNNYLVPLYTRILRVVSCFLVLFISSCTSRYWFFALASLSFVFKQAF